MTSFKDYFMLDPEVIFLNHGSFGATPRPVFETYQQWQRRLERQPVDFIIRELLDHLKDARKILADQLQVHEDELVYVPNATFGINIVARSLDLEAGDEVLTSDHEYGACDNAWEFVCERRGASYVRQSVPLPVTSADEIVELLWRGVTPRTKVIYLSHITSSTALHFPVETICRRAREAGILTIIDGAHAPGQIHLDLHAVGADFYVGNCHKWMLAPKGAGFLHTRRELQHMVEPLVVSWGWGDNSPYTAGSVYLDRLEWWGTKDPSAYLAVPAAIRFQEEHDWAGVRRSCNQLLRSAIEEINELTGLPSPYGHDAGFYHQMAIAALPPVGDAFVFQNRLYHEYKVEIPCIQWNDQQFIRLSVQAYNTQSDIDVLIRALAELL